MCSKYAIDCEMVESYGRSMLAKVSIVDYNGFVMVDEYVKPTGTVTDYREFVSGIRKHHLNNGSDFNKVKQKVSSILNGSILIGHSLKYDLDVLDLSHPKENRRDLADYKPLMKNGQPVKLKVLAMEHLGRTIQTGEHDSLEDARACMDIYKKFSNQW